MGYCGTWEQIVITAKSRYSNARIVPLPTENVAVVRIFPPLVQEFWLYTWKTSDRLDRIAAKYLGDPKDWWKIMDANPMVQDPYDIRPGQQIRIPLNA